MSDFFGAFFHFLYFAILSYSTVLIWQRCLAATTLMGFAGWGVLGSLCICFIVWQFFAYINRRF